MIKPGRWVDPAVSFSDIALSPHILIRVNPPNEPAEIYHGSASHWRYRLLHASRRHEGWPIYCVADVYHLHIEHQATLDIEGQVTQRAA